MLLEYVNNISQRVIAQKAEAGTFPASVTLNELCTIAREDILKCMRQLCIDGHYEGFLSGVNKQPALRLKNPTNIL